MNVPFLSPLDGTWISDPSCSSSCSLICKLFFYTLVSNTNDFSVFISQLQMWYILFFLTRLLHKNFLDFLACRHSVTAFSTLYWFYLLFWFLVSLHNSGWSWAVVRAGLRLSSPAFMHLLSAEITAMDHHAQLIVLFLDFTPSVPRIVSQAWYSIMKEELNGNWKSVLFPPLVLLLHFPYL